MRFKAGDIIKKKNRDNEYYRVCHILHSAYESRYNLEKLNGVFEITGYSISRDTFKVTSKVKNFDIGWVDKNMELTKAGNILFGEL